MYVWMLSLQDCFVCIGLTLLAAIPSYVSWVGFSYVCVCICAFVFSFNRSLDKNRNKTFPNNCGHFISFSFSFSHFHNFPEITSKSIYNYSLVFHFRFKNYQNWRLHDCAHWVVLFWLNSLFLLFWIPIELNIKTNYQELMLIVVIRLLVSPRVQTTLV